MTKLILRVLAVCLTVSLPSQGAAGTIVDTGTPSGDNPWGFGLGVFHQYFAGEFTIADAYAITSIEGYFGNQHGTDGTVDIAIHDDDGGYMPGTILFSASTPLDGGALIDWYGVSGLNHVLTPGTYWVSFIPSQEVSGSMPGTAPNPLLHYAQGASPNGWMDPLDFVWKDDPFYFDYVDVGIRINGDRVSTSVPDSASTLGLFLGVALVGLVAQRFRS